LRIEGIDMSPPSRRIDRLDAMTVVVAAVLVLVIGVMVVVPTARVRIMAPPLDLALDSIRLAAVCLVAVLAWVGYRERRDAFSLFSASAFLVLSAATIQAVAASIGPDLSQPLATGEPNQEQLVILTVARGFVAVLIILGGVAAWRGRSVARPGLALPGPRLDLFAILLAVEVVRVEIPPLVEGGGQGPPVTTPAGMALHLVVAGLFLGAAVAARANWRRTQSIRDGYIALGLVVAALAQVSDTIIPGTHPGPVGMGDLLRLLFTLTLLLAIEAEARALLAAQRRTNQALAELRESEVVRAALEERAWLSRELHDGLAQDMWLAKMQAANLQAMDLSPEARRMADVLTETIDTGLAEARQAVTSLRATADADSGFRDLLAQCVDDDAARFGLQVDFECTGEVQPLPVRTQAELLRITQEVLANVRRHAAATAVRVRVEATDDRFRIDITDNGRGFDPDAVRQGSYGLTTIRQRAALIGAYVVISSSPGKGTRVSVDAPTVAVTPIAHGATGATMAR
jgi:signal transduction histidine kinase